MHKRPCFCPLQASAKRSDASEIEQKLGSTRSAAEARSKDADEKLRDLEASKGQLADTKDSLKSARFEQFQVEQGSVSYEAVGRGHQPCCHAHSNACNGTGRRRMHLLDRPTVFNSHPKQVVCREEARVAADVASKADAAAKDKRQDLEGQHQQIHGLGQQLNDVQSKVSATKSAAVLH